LLTRLMGSAVAPEAAATRRRTATCALMIGLAGVVWRVALLFADTPPANSDEAIAGLAALHIAQGRDFPIFFYGQHYLGAIQSYLAAVLFAVFPPSTALLRIPPLFAYALFVLLMYRLAVRLFGGAVAVATVGALALGSDRVVQNQLIGAGGYPEVAPMLAALFLIAAGLATNAYRRPTMLFALWGLLAGLVLWTHWLAAPYLLAAAVLLVATCRRHLRPVAALITLGAMLAGAAPLIWHNLTAPREYNSVSVFLALSSAGGDPSAAQRTLGGALIGLPLASGLCSPSHCDPTRLWWAPVYLLLQGLAVAWLVAALRPGSSLDRIRAIYAGVLALAAILTVVLYVCSPSAGQTPYESARYLHFLLVSTPVWIWVLLRLLRGVGQDAGRITAALVAAAISITMVVASAELAARTSAYHRWSQDSRQLVATLKARGLTHVYGGYWTCNRLIFDTSEQILCATLNEQLGRGVNRYPAYWHEVTTNSRVPVFVTSAVSDVASTESALDAAVLDLLARSGAPFTVTRVGGYVIYQPSSPVALPAR
jgi:hypothetical protein